MVEFFRAPFEQKKPKQEKTERAIATVVYDSMSATWKDVEFEQVTHAQMQEKWKQVFEESTAEFEEQMRTKKMREIYQTQILEQMIDQVPVLLSAIDEDDWGEALELLADAVPDHAVTIFKKSLALIPAAPNQRWTRIHLARRLLEQDPTLFLDLTSFGFTEKDTVDIARRIAGKRKENIFAFVNSLKNGALTESFIHTVLDHLPGQMREYAKFAKLSPDALNTLVKKISSEKREAFRKEFNVPLKTIDDEHKIQHRENSYAQEYPIHSELFQNVADQLQQSLLDAFPERAEVYEKQSEKVRALHGAISAFGELGTLTSANPLFLYFEDDSFPAIYKPQGRDVRDMREGIPPGTYAQREWLAYQIDQALQIGTTPVTILREGPQGPGSVQEWKIAKPIEHDWRSQKDIDQNQIEDVVFDDVVKENQDRHLGNVLIGYDHSVIGIDHGLILSDDGDVTFIQSRFVDAYEGKQPSKRVSDRVMQFRTAPAVQKSLRACFDAALGDKAEVCWQKFMRGIEQLVPSDGSAGIYP